MSDTRDYWYWRFRKWMTPGLRNAQYVYFVALDTTLQEGDRWLDIGCGRRIAPSWLRHAQVIERELLERAEQVVGIDPDCVALADNTLICEKHCGVAENVPEPDASFDLVTANMVVEHLDDPGAVLTEASRLLRPGGRLLIHTPNRWYPVTAFASAIPSALRNRVTAWLEKREACDIYPTRYRMNRASTIHRLSQQAGLEVTSILRTADSPETIRLGPFVAAELALIAMTRSKPLRRLQSNLVVTLRKPTSVCEKTDTMRIQSGSERHPLPKQYGDAA